ncbi:MAG: hypothetical protein COA79_05270 [Planctomycetota bacterium]|nr:MAG: hypothetical protein COA79_05270 [Planctomycetota bacterium]
MSGKLITIRSFNTKVDADLAKLRLDTIGIWSKVVIIDFIFSGAIGGFELQVSEDHAKRANGFMDDYEKEMSDSLDELDFPDEDE